MSENHYLVARLRAIADHIENGAPYAVCLGVVVDDVAESFGMASSSIRDAAAAIGFAELSIRSVSESIRDATAEPKEQAIHAS